jgi:5-methylcytosine-specific restriction endonuclease McrA
VNPDLDFGALQKPAPKSGRLERKARTHKAGAEVRKQTRAALVKEREAKAAIRAEVWNRDGRCCRACGKALTLSTGDLQADVHCHHIVYASAGGLFVADNLASLCWDCHRKEHAHVLVITGTGALLFLVLYDKRTRDVLRAWESRVSAGR